MARQPEKASQGTGEFPGQRGNAGRQPGRGGEPPGPASAALPHDQDSEPPETGYGFRPEEYSPDDFE
jgi:hypothetical protein